MPKVFSYTIVHYGKDYLPYALKSVSPFVNQHFVFYTPHPSHGHSTTFPLIESKEDIMESVEDFHNLMWVDTDSFWNEGPQRDFAVHTLIKYGADIIINLDYDEVWAPDVLEKALEYVTHKVQARNHLINMIHFWRSFNWACTDDGWPVRIIDTRYNEGVNYLSPQNIGKVFHFGYAIRDVVLKYKMSLHGHKNELRPDWYEEKWSKWPPVNDCHPTNGIKQDGTGWWDPKPFDKNTLPDFMKSHPFYNLDKID